MEYKSVAMAVTVAPVAPGGPAVFLTEWGSFLWHTPLEKA